MGPLDEHETSSAFKRPRVQGQPAGDGKLPLDPSRAVVPTPGACDAKGAYDNFLCNEAGLPPLIAQYAMPLDHKEDERNADLAAASQRFLVRAMRGDPLVTHDDELRPALQSGLTFPQAVYDRAWAHDHDSYHLIPDEFRRAEWRLVAAITHTRHFNVRSIPLEDRTDAVIAAGLGRDPQWIHTLTPEERTPANCQRALNAVLARRNEFPYAVNLHIGVDGPLMHGLAHHAQQIILSCPDPGGRVQLAFAAIQAKAIDISHLPPDLLVDVIELMEEAAAAEADDDAGPAAGADPQTSGPLADESGSESEAKDVDDVAVPPTAPLDAPDDNPGGRPAGLDGTLGEWWDFHRSQGVPPGQLRDLLAQHGENVLDRANFPRPS